VYNQTMGTEIDNKVQITNQPDELELQAIEMRYEGYSIKEIAELLKLNYGYLRKCFAVKGKLYEHYVNYAKEEKEIRRKQAHDTFSANLNEAVRVLVQIAKKSRVDVARVQAAKEIINRQLGEPLKVVAVDEMKVNEYLQAINMYRDEKTLPTDVSSGENTSVVPSTG
jgi:hypothetical protein